MLLWPKGLPQYPKWRLGVRPCRGQWTPFWPGFLPDASPDSSAVPLLVQQDAGEEAKRTAWPQIIWAETKSWVTSFEKHPCVIWDLRVIGGRTHAAHSQTCGKFCSFFKRIPVVNDELPARIISGRVQLKPNVKEFHGSGAVFVDGSVVDKVQCSSITEYNLPWRIFSHILVCLTFLGGRGGFRHWVWLQFPLPAVRPAGQEWLPAASLQAHVPADTDEAHSGSDGLRQRLWGHQPSSRDAGPCGHESV